MMAQIKAYISFYQQVIILSSKAKQYCKKCYKMQKNVKNLNIKMQYFESLMRSDDIYKKNYLKAHQVTFQNRWFVMILCTKLQFKAHQVTFQNIWFVMILCTKCQLI